MTYTEQLRDLAKRYGVSTSYEGWDKTEHDVSDETLQAVLSALDVESAESEDVESSMVALDEAPWRRMLPPVVVAVEGREIFVPVHVPHGDPAALWVSTEDDEWIDADQVDVWIDPREIDGNLVGRATFSVPAGLPLGWHTLHAESGNLSASCTLVVTPAHLKTTESLTDGQRWGVMAQLYSIRSSRSWGVGDFGDLADIASIAGHSHGADFVLVNPLHAAEPVPPMEASPYLPTTRRFFNPLYIRVADIKEMASLPRSEYARVRELARRFDKANRRTKRIDRDPALKAKLRALKLIHRVPLSPSRQAAYDAYLDSQGEGLYNFATWSALTEKLGPDSSVWAEQAQHPGTDYVLEQQDKLADRIDFFAWLQWICDEQLRTAQDAALDAGMKIGVVHDLAVGVQRGGADTWTLGDALAEGVTVGAPPDNFNQQGQGWNQPPWRPDRLAELGYTPYRDMLRTVLRHAGGLRVDHILGLFRLWWIPVDASSPAEGTYVKYDHEALIGILALEAQRAGAVVIGEDLGVFEPMVQEYLSERGILGTSILWFERDEDAPIAPEDYRSVCLTSVTTHDLPPTAGYLAGEHIALRDKLGLLERAVELEADQDREQQDSVLDMAYARDLLTTENPSEQETVEALHALITRSPSHLLGVALVDAVGEHRIQNQPGTDDSQYHNWKVPLADENGEAVSVDDLAEHPRFVSLVRALGTSR